MRILVIGNGFDIEHELNTSYIEFLEFTKWLSCTYRGEDNSSFIVSTYIPDRYDQLKKDNEPIIKELYSDIYKNTWLSYFDRMKEEIGQNWIDFESEISRILKLLEKAKNAYSEKAFFYTSSIKPSDYYKEFHSVFYGIGLGNVTISQQTFDYQLGELREALKKLTRAFEIYLSYWVESSEITKMNPDIIGARPDRILSFNYTHTFDRVYGKSAGGLKYSYIHGEARLKSSIDDCKMVLGIDDYISDYDKDDSSEYFISFKKYYQRLDKGTDTNYRTWIEEIEKDKEKDKGKDNKTIHEVFVFGHSLDITDQGILAPIFKLENVRVTVFYHSKEKRSDLIANMIRLVGKKIVEDKIHNGTLLFRKQSASRVIDNSELEIKSDITKLVNVLTMSFSEITSLNNKIKEKIKCHDVDYFNSLPYVITVADLLSYREIWSDDYQKDVEIIIEKMISMGGCYYLNEDEWVEPDEIKGYYIIPKTQQLIRFANSRIKMPGNDLLDQVRTSIGKEYREMNEDDYLKAFNMVFEKCESNGEFDEMALNALLRMTYSNLTAARKAKEKMVEEGADDSDRQKLIMIFSTIIQSDIDTVYIDQQYTEAEQDYE